MSDFRMIPHLELSATAEAEWSFARMSATTIPSMSRERFGKVSSEGHVHFKEISDLTSKHSMLQETEEKLLLLEQQVHSALLAMDQKWLQHEAQQQQLENRLDRLEGLGLRVQSVASKSPRSPQSLQELSATPGAKGAGKLPSPGQAATPSVEKMHISGPSLQEELQSLRSKISDIQMLSDNMSEERHLLGDVQKILVRLGTVEAQVSSCRQMFEKSSAQEQENLDRIGKLRKEGGTLRTRLAMLEEQVSQMESDRRMEVTFDKASLEQGDARCSSLERQLSEMSQGFAATVAQLKHVKERLGGCEQTNKQVPTLRYTMEEAVRTAEIREEALSERLEDVEKLGTSLSDKLCKVEDSLMKIEKHTADDLQTVTAQQTAHLEVLRKEMAIHSAHCSEQFAGLQNRITECSNDLGKVPQLLSSALKRSSATSRLAGIDRQISENKEQLLKSYTELCREHHTFQAALQKQGDRVDGFQERLVRCERLLKVSTDA